jgi:hypothetical protein
MDCDALRQSDGPTTGSGFRSVATVVRKEGRINPAATRVKEGVVFSISRVQNIAALSVQPNRQPP